MRRWNGWGDDGTVMTLPAGAHGFLDRVIGPATPTRDATFETVVAAVRPGRLPVHRLVSTDPADRVLHARGQSLPDWVALRHGRIDRVPDGIAYPSDAGDVRELLRWADGRRRTRHPVRRRHRRHGPARASAGRRRRR